MSVNGFGFLQRLFFGSEDIVINNDLLLSLENTLLELDILPETIQKILKNLNNKINQKILSQSIILNISIEMIKILKFNSKPLEIDQTHKPQVVLLCGINGAGKTSTVAKMAYSLNKYNWQVVVGACDTFRSAATEQLSGILTKHIKENIILVKANKENTDPKSIAYKAYDVAKEINADILLLDTAGRLHNDTNLMDELSGIIRTLNKKNILAPHNIILIIDGNTGKNALKQVEEFSKINKINGIIITKLDGNARCGIVLSIADKFGIPIHGITTGDSIEDLQDFIPENFVKMLLKIRQ